MLEIQFTPDNDIKRIDAPEGTSPEDVILAMKNLQEAPLWLQTPAQRDRDEPTNGLVETHRLHQRETLGTVLENIEEIVSCIRENRPDDPETVSLSLDDLENTISKAKRSTVSDNSSYEHVTVPTRESKLLIEAAKREVDAMGDVGEDIHEFRDAYRRLEEHLSDDELSEVPKQPLGLVLEAADREISAMEQCNEDVTNLNEAYLTVTEKADL